VNVRLFPLVTFLVTCAGSAALGGRLALGLADPVTAEQFRLWGTSFALASGVEQGGA
jgi:hypothetical protein